MTNSTRTILVTSSLIYANGPLHLGHLTEAIQADIWTRFQRMRGHDCLYICGSDAHGTPIMISAEKRGITPEELIAEMGAEHQTNFHDALIAFDNFYTTHSEENRTLSDYVYKQLQARGDIESRTIEQAYDPIKNMFLPDRYVKGECPRCSAPDQYGDSCEVCGATYLPFELKNPISMLSGQTPITKASEHYFFRLDLYANMLRKWIHAGHVQAQVANKLQEWLESGLAQWDISRDKPYFGFEIPDHPGKYYYVWLDAPIGYMAIFKNLCARRPELDFDRYWSKDSEVELYHFIGKDVISFHALFWPAMLKGAGFRMPTAVHTHGFLTIDGQKMSKSRGTFILVRTYLNHLDPEYLRYYIAAKLSSGIDDLDLNFKDFIQRVNADLVGKVINIASRLAKFICKEYKGQLSKELIETDLYQKLVGAGDSIAAFYEAREFGRAVRSIMELADQVNQYINDKRPWALAKEPGNEEAVQAICSLGLNLFRILIIYLKPILPKLAEKSEQFLNSKPLSWNDIGEPLLGTCVNAFKPLMQRIDEKQISALLEGAKAMQSNNIK